LPWWLKPQKRWAKSTFLPFKVILSTFLLRWFCQVFGHGMKVWLTCLPHLVLFLFSVLCSYYCLPLLCFLWL
jgi:hypothetical protein